MKRSDYKPLGDYIALVNERNRDLTITHLVGVSIEKKFIPSIANIIGTDLSPYKIIRHNQFAYGPVTSRNGEKITIALYKDTEDGILSQAYEVFRIKDEEVLMPEYLMLWVQRPEFDRYARFKSHGSVREIFSWEEMCNVMLPVPPIAEQRKIVEQYQTIERRIKNNEALIQKLEATAQALYHHTFVEGIDKENLPEGWRMGKITDLAKMKVGGDKPQSFSEKKSPTNSIPIFSNGVEYDGLYGYTNRATVTEKSITISARGNVGTCFLRFDPYCGIVRLISVIPIKYTSLYFLYYFLIGMSLQGDGSAQSQITVPQLESEEVVIPSDDVMRSTYPKFESVFSMINTHKKENNCLLQILEILLSKLS